MYSVGLDIGIASCGYSIINDVNGNIVELGTLLFKSRNSDNNEERRTSRGSRRLINRRRTRLDDGKKLLAEKGFKQDPKLKHVCPYELRVKGLHEKLTHGEIYKVVLHILKKRGISYLDESDESSSELDSASYKDQVNLNLNLQKELTPGQIQLKRLKENGRIKSGVTFENGYQLNVFSVSAYANELNKILTKQSEYYSEIDQFWIDRFTKNGYRKEAGLVYRKRPYYDGPGNEKNNSIYGRWANFKVDGHPKENIFDQLIGLDSVDSTQVRASASSLTAQKYNLLNDLNNLTIIEDDRKFTTDEKVSIINYLMTQDITRFGPKELAKFYQLDVDQIRGWRIDNKGNPEIHSLKVYRDWKKIFNISGIDLTTIQTRVVDELANIITLNTEVPSTLATLKIEVPDIDQSLLNFIENNFYDLKKKMSKNSWHSFSLKTLNILIPELLNTSEEQNTILERLNLKFDLKNKYAEKKQIPVKELLEQIYNPTVTKSVHQSIKLFNEIIEKYGKNNISYVTIEMPRDKNDQDQKDTIKRINKLNSERKNDSEKYFLERSGWDTIRFESALKKPRFAEKLLYYYEQKGKCAYSGQDILAESLLNESCEVDHIIPLSISFDDSIHNKVLVTASSNQEKGQRTPYMAFIDGARLGQSWDDFVAWVNSCGFHRKKVQNLLYEENIFNPDVQRGFVSRNLNDTRYASRIVLNAIQSFFYKQKDLTKVKVVNGSFTHTLRKKWGSSLDKNRDTYHHHAVDATLCAVTPFINIVRYEFFEEDGIKYMVDLTTGEKVVYSDYKKMKFYDKRAYVPIWDGFIKQLTPANLYPKIKFSHQVDSKWNRKISDATIYSTRKMVETKINKKGVAKETVKDVVIDKIKDIYTPEGWKKFKEKQDKLLMKSFDEKTYNKLIKIAKEYPDKKEVQTSNGKVSLVEVSPFKMYCEEQNVPAIRKYSKKGNGPYIRSLKFYGKELGKHINITKDSYGNKIERTSRNKKIILKNQNPWRTDVYYNSVNNCYELLGVKYCHLKFYQGKYGIPKSIYEELKKENQISSECVFKFSLYRNDRVRFEKKDEYIEALFGSKNESSKNYFELIPIDKNKWLPKENVKFFGEVAASGQFIKGLKSGIKVIKQSTDYMGHVYAIHQEKLKFILSDA